PVTVLLLSTLYAEPPRAIPLAPLLLMMFWSMVLLRVLFWSTLTPFPPLIAIPSLWLWTVVVLPIVLRRIMVNDTPSPLSWTPTPMLSVIVLLLIVLFDATPLPTMISTPLAWFPTILFDMTWTPLAPSSRRMPSSR